MNNQYTLFSPSSTEQQPLAYKARPKNLDSFTGQEHVLSEISKLEADNPFHFIFWGPPGCGKTTLAHILGDLWKRELYNFNAVTSGIPELKKLIKSIEELKLLGSLKAIIFIDEIHRFNKAQQDVLLPFLEKGDFTLIGATTEYPQTSLNRAIISRVKLFELKALANEEIEGVLTQVINAQKLSVPQEFIVAIAHYSNGDARIALSHLEYIINLKERITNKEDLLKYLSQNARNYDKASNYHYDTISAFIKSVRGSDPDAAIFYLAIMLDGGEDPVFIARRLMILASEDIGNANPQALILATSTHYSLSQIGMPEARIPLAQCTIYLASSPKSNSAYLAIDKALAFIKDRPNAQIPEYLKNHSPQKSQYKYPHSYPEHYVKQTYKANSEVFYESTEQGFEKKLNDYLKSLKKL